MGAADPTEGPCVSGTPSVKTPSAWSLSNMTLCPASIPLGTGFRAVRGVFAVEMHVRRQEASAADPTEGPRVSGSLSARTLSVPVFGLHRTSRCDLRQFHWNKVQAVRGVIAGTQT